MSKEEPKTKLASFPPSTMAAMKYLFSPVDVFYILCRCKAARPHCLWERGSLRSSRPLLLLLQEPIYGVTVKDVLPAENPQGTQPGLRLAHGPITPPCDFPGAGPPKGTHSAQQTLEWHPAPAASQNTPCNCSLL